MSDRRSPATSTKVVTGQDYVNQAQALATKAIEVTNSVTDEANLRHELENALETGCNNLGIPWTPFQWERRVSHRFVDVVHGAIIIEYEAPKSFRGSVGRKLLHAREQAEGYARLLSKEEGRPLAEYILVAWDGSHINFGRFTEGGPDWERLLAFSTPTAQRLLAYLKTNGVPLVHPQLLSSLVGPGSSSGSRLIPFFFDAIVVSSKHQNKTQLLFAEWKRLFGQVLGVQSDRAKDLLREQGAVHHRKYEEDIPAYLFALNTYIALIAKLVAALALPNSSQNIADSTTPIKGRLKALETGRLFVDAGISNMLSGDFFSWYVDDVHWEAFSTEIDSLVQKLGMIEFDVSKKSPDSTRDLFKGIYQVFVPGALRHALGEYYTPDWLAEHALDTIGWQTHHELLDPTCGSGTFLLEALRRRLNGRQESPKVEGLLKGLYGIDLNPLAVLTAKGSLVVYLAPYLDQSNPVRIPVYLADAINPASSENGIYHHDLQTDRGVKSFEVPDKLLHHSNFFRVFAEMRELIDADCDAVTIFNTLMANFALSFLNSEEQESLLRTIQTLVGLHKESWDGIWCSILADRFAAGAIPPVQFICGNPPWVKWSHLPPDYAAFIKPRCIELGVFSEDIWVGGIESDISTVITYEVIDKWLIDGGKLGFFITGPIFTTESSAGFRRFELRKKGIPFGVDLVEDFKEVRPFERVDNHATFLVATKNQITKYPVSYRYWVPGSSRPDFLSAEEFHGNATPNNLLAFPVPGKEGGPWLKGSLEEYKVWSRIFEPGKRYYQARKGVTTDKNGIYWVQIQEVGSDGKTCRIQNAAGIGHSTGIPAIKQILETDHLFPLLRGQNVSAFQARPDAELHIIVPQRGMHGDPALPVTSPRTYRFLSQFKEQLESRSSYKRYQRNKPFWSLWSTGSYTFSPYKVLWKEMSGNHFAAAYIGLFDDPQLGPKIVIPDHKLYFVPVETEEEAAYLAGILNAPLIGNAIQAYAPQLSLGVSVVEYLHIPKLDISDAQHAQMVELSKQITHSGVATREDYKTLDELASKILGMS